MSVSVIITEAVADVLRRSTTTTTSIILPAGKIDRALYVAVDKALVALGGKWDKRAKAHVFPFDPAEKLSQALSSGKALDAVMTRKKTLQLFETPMVLARELVALLGITDEDKCLEPSAGRGRIVEALADAGALQITAVETDVDNGDALIAQGIANEIVVADFLGERPATLRASAIAMNPPFTRNQDVRHVRHAYDCLTPGGRMAAIVSGHGFIGQEREAVEFRDWLAEVGADVSIIPAGAFKESGTAIETRRIFIRKAAA